MSNQNLKNPKYTPERRDVFGPGVAALQSPETNNWPPLSEVDIVVQKAIRVRSRQHILACSREWEREGGGDDETSQSDSGRPHSSEKDEGTT
jgi:hypothetical protein